MNQTSRLKLLGDQDDSRSPGLIWAFHRNARSGETRMIPPADINATIAANSGWVWLHVDLVDQRAHGWLNETCALPAAARSILEAHDFSFSLGHEDGVIHGVSPELHSELARQSNIVGLLYFAVSEHLLVTGRRHPLSSVADVKTALDAGTLRPATAFELFEAIIMTFGRNAERRLREASLRLDDVEDHLVADKPDDERHSLKQVRRLAVSLHRPVATLAALFRDQDKSDWKLSGDAHKVLRRLTTRLERLDREVMSISDRARLLQEELSAELADQSNRSLRALAVISALLLPGTLVAGIFGMNTSSTPLTEGSGGFAVAMLLGVAATGIFYWLLRRAGVNLRL